jgi:hypothetical protein
VGGPVIDREKIGFVTQPCDAGQADPGVFCNDPLEDNSLEIHRRVTLSAQPSQPRAKKR